jgi:hypothetical protein
VRDRVRPGAKLISGGLAPGTDIGIVDWVDQMARLGGLELVDGLGVHPYSPLRSDDPRAWMMQLKELHDRLGALGRPALGLWLTEYGAPTSQARKGWGPPLTEEQQAQRPRVAFSLATRLPFVEQMTWFEYRDSCADAQVCDCHFGLVRDDFSRRPAYYALGDVTAGSSTALRPRLALTRRVESARVSVSGGRPPARRELRVVRGEGRLLLPGGPRSGARVTLRVLRRGARPKTLRRIVRHEAFAARLRGIGRRRWRVIARYAGSAAMSRSSLGSASADRPTWEPRRRALETGCARARAPAERS